MPKFSIVIPTRNRAYTLGYTIKTCLNQYGFDDYEVIISDNDSTDNTAEMVKEFNSDKIKYYKTERSLPMTDNYNFAISKATGEYVLFLGSDDAIHTHGLYFLDRIISITGEKIISWLLNSYYWPDVTYDLYKNLLYLRNKATEIRNAKNCIKKAITDFDNQLNNMPSLYLRTAIHRDLINDLKNNTGVVFDSTPPDIYSGIVFSSMATYYIYLGIPIGIVGASSRGNGAATRTSDPITKENIELDIANNRLQTGAFFNAGLGSGTECISVSVFNFVKERLKIFSDLNVDNGKLIKAVIEECYRRFNMYLGNKGKENFQEDLAIIKEVIKNNPEYKASLSSNSLNLDDYEFYEPIYNRIPSIDDGCLKFDASLFGINNIYDATLFAEKLLYSKEYIDAYLDRFEKDWSELKNMFARLGKYERLGIFATGKHTEHFIGLYKHFCGKDPIALFDNNNAKWESIFCGHKVLPPESIPDNNLDALVISSRRFQNEIYDSIKKYAKYTEIVNLYDKIGEEFIFRFIYK